MSTSPASKSCCSTGSTGTNSWASDRRVLVAAAVAAVGAALWFGWPWLVVAGIAPLLIALAPCLIMCGAMCAMKACCKPSKKAAVEADLDPKLLTHEAPEQHAVVASSQFSRSSMQPARPAGTRMPA